MLVLLAGCSEAQPNAGEASARLVISFPGVPNPPERDPTAGRLFHGQAQLPGNVESTSPARILSEVAIQCDQRKFTWRDLASDHGQEMVFQNNAEARRAVACIAGKVPFDFYVRVERA